MQWFTTVASVPEKQVIKDTLKDLLAVPLPNTNSTTKFYQSMSLDIGLFNRSSDDTGTYAAIKQKIVKYIKA